MTDEQFKILIEEIQKVKSSIDENNIHFEGVKRQFAKVQENQIKIFNKLN